VGGHKWGEKQYAVVDLSSHKHLLIFLKQNAAIKVKEPLSIAAL
jgi:hypothetical protein